MDLQPYLEDDHLIARPLSQDDFKELFALASDPSIWNQHPNPNRYQEDEFRNFFRGAIRSGGAFLVLSKITGTAIGTSRFYDWKAEEKSVLIGYTFFSRESWGKNNNKRLKALMLDHAFQYVEKVIFHIGAANYRSQNSIDKLGAKKTGEQLVEYYGEKPKLNFVYEIKKEEWLSRKTAGV